MSRLRQVFLKTGHIYISSHDYISIEVYSSDQMTCDYVARTLGGVVNRRTRTYKLAIYNRVALAQAARKLLEVIHDDIVEAQLRLVLEYATAVNRKARKDAVRELRKLLIEEKDDHTKATTTND